MHTKQQDKTKDMIYRIRIQRAVDTIMQPTVYAMYMEYVKGC